MGTNTNESEVKCVNNIIGRNASLASAPKLWSGFGMIKWMTFLLELQRPVVHLKEWTWEKIFTQANTQEVDDDINSNVDPTSLAIQVLVFGAISKDVPISLRSATCAHKGLGGAPNKTLKIYV
jgi:hypothetical protein